MSRADPILAAVKSALLHACVMNEGSAWLMADRVIVHLDGAGYRIIGARTPELRESRTMTVDLATYQQILGDRNALRDELRAANAQLERYRDMVGEAEGDVMEMPTMEA